MLTGATPKALHNKITSRMQAMASGRIANDEDEKEIKLCYVTVCCFATGSSYLSLFGTARKNCQEQGFYTTSGKIG